MAKTRSTARRLAIGSMLVSGGALLGVGASAFTSSAIRWQSPARFYSASASEPLPREGVDQAASGEAWARSAFWSGLTRCPKMNPQFLAACEAEMAALESRPDFAEVHDEPAHIPNIEEAAYPDELYFEPELLDAGLEQPLIDAEKDDPTSAPAIALPPPLFVPA